MQKCYIFWFRLTTIYILQLPRAAYKWTKNDFIFLFPVGTSNATSDLVQANAKMLQFLASRLTTVYILQLTRESYKWTKNDFLFLFSVGTSNATSDLQAYAM